MSVPPPYPYQARAIAHGLKHARCGLFLEPGLGKTRISIEVVKQLPKPIIVLAPKRVIDHTWPSELAKWWPECRWLSLADGPDSRLINYGLDADMYLLNFEMFAKMFGKDGEHKWRYPTVIIDESHNVKNRDTFLFKALRYNAGKIRHLLELTGTPAPKSLEDLWAQVFLLDRGQRLGRTITAFRQRWFAPGAERYQRHMRPAAQDQIQSRISDICMSMTAAEYLDLPEFMTQDIVVDLPPKARIFYDKLKEDLVAKIGEEQITAMTAATLAGKLLQVTSGNVYNENHQSVHSNTAKLDALRDLQESLGDLSLLVSYQYQHELEALRKLGAVELRDAPDTVRRWNKGQIKMMAIYPSSGGVGLNLQDGGHHLVWTTPTYNLGHYIQTNARLHRTGQTRPVVVHRLVAAQTIDRHVYSALARKASVQEALMDALEVFVW
ncbi:MAG: SNF2-related protein [Fluviibacter phosphoraccumulans]